MILFARNEEINRWLEENPLVLGGIACLIGLMLVGYGVSALSTGQATSKRGYKLEGTNAKLMGYVWTGFGGLALAFGIYKIILGVI